MNTQYPQAGPTIEAEVQGEAAAMAAAAVLVHESRWYVVEPRPFDTWAFIVKDEPGAARLLRAIAGHPSPGPTPGPTKRIRRQRAAWIDVMGVAPVYVEATFDSRRQRVLVTPDVLGAMIDGVRHARLFDDESVEGLAQALQESPVVHGLRDVTDLGGGWDQWTQQVLT